MKSQSVSLFWRMNLCGPPLEVASTEKPYSVAIFFTMSDDVWFRNVRCLRRRIIRCDLS